MVNPTAGNTITPDCQADTHYRLVCRHRSIFLHSQPKKAQQKCVNSRPFAVIIRAMQSLSKHPSASLQVRTKPGYRRYLLPLLLLAAGLLAYCNSYAMPLIYDDDASIIYNPYIKTLWPPTGLFLAPPNSPVQGRPLVSFSMALNYALGGLNVLGYHIYNIAIHILGALTLFGIVRRTLLGPKLRDRFATTADNLAFTCALLWMVHPMLTECVVYITQRTESMMGLFYLLTLYCAIRALASAYRFAWYASAVLACCLGMACKEVMVTAPLIVFLYDIIFSPDSFSRTLRRRWPLYLGLVGAWAVLAVLMISFPLTNVGFSISVGPWGYAKNQCLIIIDYLRLVFWPRHLALDYGFPQTFTLTQVAPYGVLLIALLAATALALIRCPMIGFLGLWFFVILGPTSSFVPMSTEVGAERRMYLPLAAVIVLVVIAGHLLLRRTVGVPQTGDAPDWDQPPHARLARWAGRLIVVILATLLTWATLLRNQDYQSQVAIWHSAVLATPDNPRALSNFGNALYDDDQPDRAMHYFRRTLEVAPGFPEAHYNLGHVYQQQGDYDQAVSHYLLALRGHPDCPDAHNNLGVILQKRGQIDQAIAHYQRALKISPDPVEAHTNLGTAYKLQGKLDLATYHFREALKIKPDYLTVHRSLALILHSQGNFEQAISHYRHALQKDPKDAQTHNNLGLSLRSVGRLDEAVDHYRQALALDPADAYAHINLADVLKSQGALDTALSHYQTAAQLAPDSAAVQQYLGSTFQALDRFDEALGFYRRALQTDPNNTKVKLTLAGVLETLAKGHAADGNFDQAITAAREAIGLAQATGNTQLVDRIAQQLTLYRAGKL